MISGILGCQIISDACTVAALSFWPVKTHLYVLAVDLLDRKLIYVVLYKGVWSVSNRELTARGQENTLKCFKVYLF